jgi:glycosyltransferase involved in cell wall biosynthesis
MRLLHVIPTYLPAWRYGGPIVATHGLCRALAARGHEVEVFTTSVNGRENSPVPHDSPVMLDGVKIRYFLSPLLRRLYYAPSLSRTLRREIRGADIVHLHSIFLWPTWRAARIAQATRVPHVISPRGMLVKRLIAARSRLVKSAWIALIERSNLEGAAAIHATSQVERQEIERFGWRLQRLAVVPNALDAQEMPARDGTVSADIAALGREQPLILYFGRLARVKALDRLLHAFAKTQRGVLAIVGTDYEGLATQLSQLARKLHIDHRVRLLPRTVTGVDKEYIFGAARLFVLSSYSESFGNSVLEALQRGLPVIVTPEVGAAEVVKECGGGLVVDGDPQTFGHAMDMLIGDAGRLSTMGEAGRRHVLSHYGWPSIAARMEALYEDVRKSR